MKNGTSKGKARFFILDTFYPPKISIYVTGMGIIRCEKVFAGILF